MKFVSSKSRTLAAKLSCLAMERMKMTNPFSGRKAQLPNASELWKCFTGLFDFKHNISFVLLFLRGYFSSLIESKYIFDDDSCGEETDEDRRVRNKPS